MPPETVTACNAAINQLAEQERVLLENYALDSRVKRAMLTDLRESVKALYERRRLLASRERVVREVAR